MTRTRSEFDRRRRIGAILASCLVVTLAFSTWHVHGAFPPETQPTPEARAGETNSTTLVCPACALSHQVAPPPPESAGLAAPALAEWRHAALPEPPARLVLVRAGGSRAPPIV